MAKFSGLTPVTVNYVLEQLMGLGLVAAVGEGPSTGGRKPTLYALNRHDSILCGVDVSIERVTVGLLDLAGKMLWRKSSPRGSNEWNELQIIMEETIREGSHALGTPEERMVGAAVCIPGFVDLSGKTVVLDVNLNFNNLNLGDALQARLGIPVFVVGQATAWMLAELEFGKSNLGEDVIYVQVGTGMGRGIGGAIMSKGGILRGGQGFAGEIGHMSIDPQGPKCTCGRNGCWEAVGQLSRFVSEVRQRVPGPHGEEFSHALADVCDLVQSDDERITDIFARFVNVHAEAISNLIHIFNPSTVVIGGEIARFGESFLGPLRQATENLLMVPFRESYRILPSIRDEDKVLRGAAVVLLEEAIALRQRAG